MRSLLFLFGRSVLERLVESHGNQEVLIGAQNARIIELERSLATEKARFEWLTVHVNELKAERAALFQRALDVQIPSMVIERQPEPFVLNRPEPRLTPEALKDQVGSIPSVMRRRGGEPRDMNAQIAEAMEAGDLFNDVGDEKARAMGLGWDPEGVLVTDVPPAVASAR